MLARPSGQNHGPAPGATHPVASKDGGVGSGAAGEVVNLPNIITFARLCAVPFAIWLALHHRFGATLGVFVAAGISDAVDGYLARRRGGTVLGATLDPLADKALLVGMFVTLGALGILPDWLAILVVFRDLVITGGVAVLWGLGHPVRIRPLWISKLNTTLQIVLVALALLAAALGVAAGPWLGTLVWVVAATTLASGASYVGRVARTG